MAALMPEALLADDLPVAAARPTGSGWSPDQETQASYDELPYLIRAYRLTHPDLMATQAVLHGLHPPPPDRCRVLELGSAGGGNLFPLAAQFPRSSFCGIDLSPRQVAMARQAARQLGLTNVTLLEGDLRQLAGWPRGRFDYIICHGVFSWVPPAVQQGILSICKHLLAPTGVALVSYNTYPGWYSKQVARDLMQQVAQPTGSPLERVTRGLGFLHELAMVAPGDAPHGALLRELTQHLGGQPDSYLFHEYFEPHNTSFYFGTFIRLARAAGLEYLDELLRGENEQLHDPDVLRRLDEYAEGDPILLEQWLDILNHRSFRVTLLCQAEAAGNLTPRPQPARMSQLWLAATCRAIADEPDSTAVTEFRGDNDVPLYTKDPALRSGLRVLCAMAPRFCPFPELWRLTEQLHARTGQPAPNREQLAGSLLECLQLGLIEARLVPPAFATVLPERPRASRIARWLATLGDDQVVNLLHRMTPVSPAERLLLPLLNGERTVPELLVAVQHALWEAGLAPDDPEATRHQPGAQEESALTLAWIKRALNRFLLRQLLDDPVRGGC